MSAATHKTKSYTIKLKLEACEYAENSSNKIRETKNMLLIVTTGRPIDNETYAVAERPCDASCLSVISLNIPTAQFLPRDAMHKRGLCCHAVSCLSLRPSVRPQPQ